MRGIAIAVLAVATALIIVPVAQARPIGGRQAAERVGKYARVICNNPRQARGCEAWAVSNCQRHDRGISCKVHLFIRRKPWMSGRPGKSECIRLVWVNRTDRDFLGGWTCERGWSGYGSAIAARS